MGGLLARTNRRAELSWDDWPTLAVVDAPGSVRTIGTANATGWVQHRNERATAYRLNVNTSELPGRWHCVGREFVRLGVAAGKTDDDEMRARPA
jgi:hypothetical protein